jgi:hypothetical protein
MQLLESLPGFNAAAALQKQQLLPASPRPNRCPVSCCHCRFVNPSEHNFCTYCGYPLHPSRTLLDRYHLRLQKRRKLQRKCLKKIEHARNALYLLAACSMVGIFYVFSATRQTATTGFVMVLLGMVYAALGRWSLTKPFTALLISLIISLTFTVANTWGNLTSSFSTSRGLYLFIIQLIFIHFLLGGVKGAFRADLLEEEFKV